MSGLWSDIRFGLRVLMKNRGFTVIAVLTLALGIGANTAIFGLANALLLRPLPGIEKPDQLVLVGRTHNGAGFGALSYPEYVDYRDQDTSLSGLVAYRRTEIPLINDETVQPLAGVLVSNNYFLVLGAHAIKGRTLGPEDEGEPGAYPVCVISYGLWKRYFALDQNIIGKDLNLNGHRFSIVGVMEETFAGTEIGASLDVWVPITMYAQVNPLFKEKRLEARHIVWLRSFGRLKRDATVEQAQAQFSALASQLEQTYPDINKDAGVRVFSSVRFDPQSFGEVRRSTALLMSIVALVLLIACANVANLLLARSSARQREIGVRLALGVSRGRLIRQLLTEALLLGFASGLLGLLVALLVNDVLTSINPLPVTRSTLGLSVDGRVLVFTLFVSLTCTLLFALVPALQATKQGVASQLRQKNEVGARHSRIPRSLIVAQCALSVITLISAGLLVRTLKNIQAIPPGFEIDRVLFASLDLSRQGYSETQGRLFYQQVIETVESLPGVSSAGLAVMTPLGGSWRTGLQIEGKPSDESLIPCDYNIVAPGYFETMGIPLVSGRDFSPRDSRDTPGVVAINETFARQFFPEQNPIGKRLLIPNSERAIDYFEIIAVVKDAKYRWLTETSQPYAYLSALQQYQPTMNLYVRVQGSAETLIGAVQQQVQALDNRLFNFNLRPLNERLYLSLRPQRSAAVLIGTFGLLALLLTSVGLYGVIAYAVSRRTQEIGIRMALGAQRRDISRMVLGEGMLLVAIGVIAGLAGALAVSRLLSGFLHGVSATDPATFLATILLLGGVAFLASWIPARRATKVDPLTALRCE